MRHVRTLTAIAFAGALLIGLGGNAGADPVSPAGRSRIETVPAIEIIVHDKRNPETVTQKVKRIWRNLTGYKFDVVCSVFPFVVTITQCTATGKNREDARAKCQSQHAFCQIRDANR
jgi:hypothetical protein